MELLLAAGADVNAQRLKNGFTPLVLAVLFDEAEIAERLMQSGADPNQEFERKTMRRMWEPENRKSEMLSAFKMAQKKPRNKKIRKLLLGHE